MARSGGVGFVRFAPFLLACCAALMGQQRPNVVLILTDNHGAWTLGAYGNRDILTPNLDRMAEEGLLFEQAFANNAVCSPTRATLLTGLMPSQHGVHRYLGAGRAQIGPDAYNTLAEFNTIPSLLVDAGYTAGLVGKWHLGDNLRPQEGFSYWITMPHGASPGFYGQEVIENGAVRREPGYLTDLWTEHGARFIEQNRDKPFFLYLAYNGPYGLGAAMREPIRNRHAAHYLRHPFPSMPRDAAHPWNHIYAEWVNRMDVRAKYAAEVSAIDDGVGRILSTLERLGLDEDTLVIFMGDQGLAGGHSGFWGMGDHTRPLTAFDWTMWIPMIFRHKGSIPPGRRSELLVSNYDVFPSLLAYLGVEAPQQPPRPGRNFEPLLRGSDVEWSDEVFYEFENVRAIRTSEWKYIERIHQSPNELYDLRSDAGERLNRHGAAELAQVQADLKLRLHSFFDRYAEPQWNLWKEGASKTGLITADLFGQAKPLD